MGTQEKIIEADGDSGHSEKEIRAEAAVNSLFKTLHHKCSDALVCPPLHLQPKVRKIWVSLLFAQSPARKALSAVQYCTWLVFPSPPVPWGKQAG